MDTSPEDLSTLISQISLPPDRMPVAQIQLVNDLNGKIGNIECVCVALGNQVSELNVSPENPALLRVVELAMFAERLATELRGVSESLYREIHRNGASSALEFKLQSEMKVLAKEPVKVTTPTESKKTESDWRASYTGEKK